MFRLLTSISAGELFKRQLPVCLVAFLIAELFYKFHSFTLECSIPGHVVRPRWRTAVADRPAVGQLPAQRGRRPSIA